MARPKQLALFENDSHPSAGPQSGAGGGRSHLDRSPFPVDTTAPPCLPPGACWCEVDTPLQKLGFVLKRSRRKTIGLLINDDGLQVTAPTWVSLKQVQDAVRQKAPWAIQKLRRNQERQERLAMADTQWQAGGYIPYFGRSIRLALDGGRGAAFFTGDALAPQDGDTLHLALPASAERERVRETAYAWLQQQAQHWFGQRLQHFQALHDLKVSRWRLSSATTRWGSCTSDGRIMLNWRLIHFEHHIIDYVIAHELAHLREMNHSPAFWRVVGQILPGFERARDALRQHNPGSLPLL